MIGRMLRALSLIAATVLLLAGAARQAERPILILISLDGWRWDYLDPAQTPHLHKLAAAGVRAEGLIPAFPSKTFPNHYTIVTGLSPEHHGIVSNTMVDRTIGRFTMSSATAKDARWWGGEPLWVTAIRQGRRASVLFWPGSEAPIGGVRPNDWLPYSDAFPNTERIDRMLTWLARPEGERPSFLTLYFNDVDSAGHSFGPDSAQVMAAAARLDGLIGSLIAGVEKLGLASRTHYVVVSDHGMSQLSSDRTIFLDDYIDLSTIEVVDWSPALQILPRSGSVEDIYRALKSRHPSLAVYRREEMPLHLRYRAHPRIPPIIGLADDGWSITSRARSGGQRGGDHGYDPFYRSMHGLFVASGPAFRRGAIVPAFENIHIYDLMCRVLGLTPARNDGDPALASRFLSR
ncbi:MAG TPA: ectonucleotide pyrophosphatase/phosphodiesterase [Vicinamibacterales bacterium]|nr:ectonucleotide pyrophosphatase/phosphodiesterase [Vicinamibacterales bacterium]